MRTGAFAAIKLSIKRIHSTVLYNKKNIYTIWFADFFCKIFLKKYYVNLLTKMIKAIIIVINIPVFHFLSKTKLSKQKEVRVCLPKVRNKS